MGTLGRSHNPLVGRELAAKYRVSPDLVEQMLRIERDSLLQGARITTYIPLLSARHVEEQLRGTPRK